MNKKWLCEIRAISNLTKELETFISDEYIEAKTLQEAKEIALQDFPYLNPIEEIRELEMFTFNEDNDPQVYLLEVSDDLINYN